MAYPFRPMSERKLKKLTRKREDSNSVVTVSNRPPEFKTHDADFHQNQTRFNRELNRRKMHH
jgi:hypothetical protein